MRGEGGGGEPVRRAAPPYYAALPFTPTVLPGAATGPVLTEPVGAGAGKHGDGPAEAGAAGGTPRGQADPPPPSRNRGGPGTARLRRPRWAKRRRQASGRRPLQQLLGAAPVRGPEVRGRALGSSGRSQAGVKPELACVYHT